MGYLLPQVKGMYRNDADPHAESELQIGIDLSRVIAHHMSGDVPAEDCGHCILTAVRSPVVGRGAARNTESLGIPVARPASGVRR